MADETEIPKNLTREETMSMISHELRTSLTASKWMLDMLQDGDVGELTTSQKEVVAKLMSSNSRMMDVATNLIALSKTSSHESEYHMGEIDIVDIIDSVVFELGSEAFSQHIEIIYVKPDQAIPKVHGDESKLRIVFQNLIDNAIKYSNSGGRVVISLVSENDNLKITIKDSGIGIDPKDMPMVMNEFYRAPNAVQKVSAGSGIGLYICKRILEDHGGSITLESSLGQGTTITIHVPVSKN